LKGPDDTTYFSSEEEESGRRLPTKKPARPSAQFTGANLPFVGYTYIQNLHPQVGWGNLGDSNSKDSISLIKSSNPPISKQQLETLEQKYKDEVKRTGELTSVKLQLEEDNRTLKLEAARVKASLEADIKDLTDSNSREQLEKKELEKRVVELQQLLDRESNAKTELSITARSLAERENELKKTNDQLTAELNNEKINGKQIETSLAEISKQKAVLEVEMKEAYQQLEIERSLKSESDKQILELNRKLEEIGLKRSELESERTQTSQKLNKVSEELSMTSSQLFAKSSELEKLQKLLEDSERSILLLKLDLSTLTQKSLDLTTENTLLIKQFGDLRNEFDKYKASNIANSDHEKALISDIALLKDQLEQSQLAKQNLSENIASLQKEKSLLQIKVTETEKKYLDELSSHDETKLKVGRIQAKLIEMDAVVIALEETKIKVEAQNTALEAELKKIKSSWIAELEIQRASQEKFIELQKSKVALISDLEDAKTKLAAEQINIKDLNSKLQNIQLSLQSETRSRVLFENQAKEYETAKEELKNEVYELRNKFASLKQDRDKRLQDLGNSQSQLRMEQRELRDKYELDQKLRQQLEEDFINTQKELTVSKSIIRDWETKYDQLSTELFNQKDLCNEHTVQLRNSETNRLSLQDRIQELEAIQLKSSKTSSSTIKLDKEDNNDIIELGSSLQSINTITTSKGNTAPRNLAKIRSFFKSKDITDSSTISSSKEVPAGKLSQILEDFRNSPHKRVGSTTSITSGISGNSFKSVPLIATCKIFYLCLF